MQYRLQSVEEVGWQTSQGSAESAQLKRPVAAVCLATLQNLKENRAKHRYECV